MRPRHSLDPCIVSPHRQVAATSRCSARREARLLPYVERSLSNSDILSGNPSINPWEVFLMPRSAFSRCITLLLVTFFVGLAPPLTVLGQEATPGADEDRSRAIFPGA